MVVISNSKTSLFVSLLVLTSLTDQLAAITGLKLLSIGIIDNNVMFSLFSSDVLNPRPHFANNSIEKLIGLVIVAI